MKRPGMKHKRLTRNYKKAHRAVKIRRRSKTSKIVQSKQISGVANTQQRQQISIGERLHHLLTETSVVIYASRPSGDYAARFVSENVERLTGYKHRSFTRKASFWLDHVHPEDRERVLREIPQLFKNGYYEYEYRFKHKNGNYMWVHDEMKLLCDDKGKPIEIIGYWTDVTRRREMEEDSRQRTMRIRDFMESATEGFVLLDSNFSVIDANRYLLDQFGWKIEEARGANILDVSTELWESGRYEKYLEVLETGKPCIFRDVVTPPKFGSIHLNIIAFRAGDNLGLIVQDITEHKKAEQQLLEKEERLRLVYDSISAGIVVIDREGFITSANKSACEILDLTEDEIIGSPLAELCNAAVDNRGVRLAAEDHPFAETLRTFRLVRNKIIGIPSDDPAKKIWLLINTEPIFDPETKQLDEVLCTFRDISEQKNVGDALEESEARYRHLFENAPFGIGIAAMDGKVITANKAMLEITGYTLDEIRKINITDTYVDVDDRLRLLQIMNQRGQITNYRVRLKKKDGTIYDAVLDVSRINLAGRDYLHTMCRLVQSQKND